MPTSQSARLLARAASASESKSRPSLSAFSPARIASGVSEEIHSQYLVSYKPSNGEEGGYHTITVAIDRHPEYICKTRPGYWIGGGAQ